MGGIISLNDWWFITPHCGKLRHRPFFFWKKWGTSWMSQWPKGFGDSTGDNSRKDLAAEKGCKGNQKKNMMCNMNEEERTHTHTHIYIYIYHDFSRFKVGTTWTKLGRTSGLRPVAWFPGRPRRCTRPWPERRNTWRRRLVEGNAVRAHPEVLGFLKLPL